jgi:tRNA dimethylallyltransferase
MSSSIAPPLAVIAGPTASGKSALALGLAEAKTGVIINADASQCYADLSILTARPGIADMARAPHRLFGFLAADTPLSAAGWAALATAEIDAAHRAGMLPIVVGGTGLYIRTLLGGIAAVPPIDPAVRADVRALPAAALAAALAAEDAEMHRRLAPTDRQRMARALEVVRSTGRSLASYQDRPTGGIAARVALHPLVIDVDRDELYRRCDVRLDAMLAAGALDEAARLLGRNLAAELPIMKSIGVPPLARHLRGEITLDAAIADAKRDTRRYAKRQLTWFRNQSPDWPRVRS